MNALDVVTFGETMAVLIAEPGVPLTEATSFRRTVAGSESNVAIGLARLGHRVGWFGRVGADAFGHVVHRAIRGEGVDTRHVVVDPEGPTGLLIRDAHGGRGVDVLYFRSQSAGSRLAPADVDPDYIASARILHVSGITPLLSDDAREATAHAVDIARQRGVLVSFDPNIRRRLADDDRAREVLQPLAESADIVLAGDDEADLLSGGTGARWFLDRGADLVVIKQGAAGAWATDGETTWRQPPTPVDPVDPVGAGDAFAAGFLSGLIHGEDVPGRLRRAAAYGAFAVTAVGDTEGLPREIPSAAVTDVRR